jgi:spore coat polysaccharide biosynthesis protein SpsF
MSSSPFTFGTVQLGVPYGVANLTGQPPRETAISVVRQAVACGVVEFDCARGYGEAESILGEALRGPGAAASTAVRITTKLDPLSDIDAASEHQLVTAAERSVTTSLELLHTRTLDALLLHRWAHHDACGGAIWKRLLRLRHLGHVAMLGASVYNPDEALLALRDPDVEQLQIPFNVLDRRWLTSEIQAAFAVRSDVIVHARSALLQGILAATEDVWPRLPGIARRTFIEPLDALVGDLGRESRADLCLSYVRAQHWIHSVVVGMETENQLTQNVALFEKPPLSRDEVDLVNRRVPAGPDRLINPALWSQA